MTSSGNIQNQYGYYDWNIQGGRLEWIKTTDTYPTTTIHQHLEYLYDSGGNVTQIKDYQNGNPQTQSFTYDNLSRLTSAGSPSTGFRSRSKTSTRSARSRLARR